jgi:hypothetical protein
LVELPVVLSDRIFGEECRTAEVYETRTKRIVDSVVRGRRGRGRRWASVRSPRRSRRPPGLRRPRWATLAPQRPPHSPPSDPSVRFCRHSAACSLDPPMHQRGARADQYLQGGSCPAPPWFRCLPDAFSCSLCFWLRSRRTRPSGSSRSWRRLLRRCSDPSGGEPHEQRQVHLLQVFVSLVLPLLPHALDPIWRCAEFSVRFDLDLARSI